MAPRSRARLRAVDGTIEDRLYADAGEVADWANGLPAAFLHCRDMQHNWRPHNARRHPDGGFVRVLRCVRCKSRKVQNLDSSGMVVGSSRYEHAEGYLHAGLGRIVGQGRGALRLESIIRLLPDDE